MDAIFPHENTIQEPRPSSDDDQPVSRSWTTRIVHLLLLLVVVNQLAGSYFMSRPFPGDDSLSLYLVHQYAGLAGFAVVAAFWIWTLVRRGETSLGRLVPWLSRSRRRDVWDDLSIQVRHMMRGHGPDDRDGALASAVHGLGLLAVTAMAATGTIWFVSHGTPAHLAMTVHKIIANLAWAYLFAHAGLAVLHWLLGSDIFSRMFWPARRAAR